MKNFRKVLALILVAATLFSFVAMASAKTTADYSDAKDVKYVEAVDVLSAIGILKGYDGAYHPTLTIDRDEMAKMIAVLRNGGEDNSALFTGANAFADVKGSWAEGYIAYAAQVGIINGRNATTFDPEGKVTGTEIMKMLLCVLGYDAKEQGYVGSNWQVNVLRDATKMDLMAGLEGFDPYKAATRDEAAQLMYNALKANMVVGYVSENIVKVTNALYKWPNSISTPDAEKSGYEFAYCNAVISDIPLYTIINGLKLVDTDETDCYNRPGHMWQLTVNKKVTFEKFYVDTPVYTQHEGDASAVVDAMKDYDKDEKMTWAVYEDGKLVKDTAGKNAIGSYKDLKSYINAGNGVLVELYDTCNVMKTVDKETVPVADYTVVVVNTYIAKVDKVSEYYNYFTLKNSDGKEIAKYALNDYEIKSGDMVLYWLCNGTLEGDDKNANTSTATTKKKAGYYLHNLKVVTPKATTVTEGVNYKDWNTSYIIASGETYKYAVNLGEFYNEGADYRLKYEHIKDNDKFDLYLDEYGFIKYLENTSEKHDYFYAYLVEGTYNVHEHGYGYDEDGNKVWNKDYTVDLVKYGTDGTLSVDADVATNKETEDHMIGADQKAFSTGVLAKLEVNSDEETVIETVGNFAKAGTELDKDNFKLGNDLYATSETLFMIRTKNLDGTYTYEQVTGYKNLKGSYVAKDVDGKTNIQYFLNEDHSNKNDKGFVTHVFIDATYTRDFAAKFLLLDDAKYYAFDTALKELYADDYVSYNALVDGEQAVVLVSREAAKKITDNYTDPLKGVGKVYKADLSYINVTKNDLPIYVMVEKVDPNMTEDFVACYYNVVDGETYIRSTNGEVYKLAENAKVWTLTIKVVDGEKVADAYEGYLDVTEGGATINYSWFETNDGGEITVLYRVDSDYTTTILG